LVAACHHGGGGTGPTTDKNYKSWSVMKQGDSCTAYDSDQSCPENATCNPPPPMQISCPDGMIEGQPMTVVQPIEGVECWTQPPNGTAPMQIACPSAR